MEKEETCIPEKTWKRTK